MWCFNNLIIIFHFVVSQEDGFLELYRLGGHGHLKQLPCLYSAMACISQAHLQHRASTYEKLLWGSLKAKADPDEVEAPCLLDESNLKSMYYMLDITKKGYISKEQYLQAMGAIGARKFNENPSGANLNKITLETFLRETKASLRDASATYNDL